MKSTAEAGARFTANALSWAMVAGELAGRVRPVAPDLRGRARSAGLPGPHGMAALGRALR